MAPTSSLSASASNDNGLDAVLFAQQADGSWQASDALARNLAALLAKSLTLAQLIKLGGAAADANAAAWTTAFVVAVLHARCSERRAEWLLIERKAAAFVRKQGQPDMLQSAVQAVGSL
eukprot:NODE_5052_length_729_cov_48.521595_g5029_i0.p2 GENE.NODE_5052_length_729_cov_48.521595_g5029_i0~~NODE_5052_length_729_cov_48.521595_g5029_i0.p2  ORF type:complete len:119 (+),score=35.27 NODE_5052_length_729_cov_48.521595_g5029_i0:243-599(+)